MQRKVVICLLVCLFLVPCAWGHSNKMCWDGDKIRVLDWNVYIGTDVIAVVLGLFSIDDAVDQIIDSDITSRAETISKHIGILNPDVVFLQEMWQVIIVESNETDAEVTVYDFLAVFEAKLENYVVAGVHELTNLQLPYKETGFVNLLDRDVVFVRKDIEVLGTENVPYDTLLEVQFDGMTGKSASGITDLRAVRMLFCRIYFHA